MFLLRYVPVAQNSTISPKIWKKQNQNWRSVLMPRLTISYFLWFHYKALNIIVMKLFVHLQFEQIKESLEQSKQLLQKNVARMQRGIEWLKATTYAPVLGLNFYLKFELCYGYKVFYHFMQKNSNWLIMIVSISCYDCIFTVQTN